MIETKGFTFSPGGRAEMFQTRPTPLSFVSGESLVPNSHPEVVAQGNLAGIEALASVIKVGVEGITNGVKDRVALDLKKQEIAQHLMDKASERAWKMDALRQGKPMTPLQEAQANYYKKKTEALPGPNGLPSNVTENEDGSLSLDGASGPVDVSGDAETDDSETETEDQTDDMGNPMPKAGPEPLAKPVQARSGIPRPKTPVNPNFEVAPEVLPAAAQPLASTPGPVEAEPVTDLGPGHGLGLGLPQENPEVSLQTVPGPVKEGPAEIKKVDAKQSESRLASSSGPTGSIPDAPIVEENRHTKNIQIKPIMQNGQVVGHAYKVGGKYISEEQFQKLADKDQKDKQENFDKQLKVLAARDAELAKDNTRRAQLHREKILEQTKKITQMRLDNQLGKSMEARYNDYVVKNVLPKKLELGKSALNNFVEALRTTITDPNNQNVSDLDLADNYIGFARGASSSGSGGQVTEAQYDELKHNRSLYSKLEMAIQSRTQGRFLSDADRRNMLNTMLHAHNNATARENANIEKFTKGLLVDKPDIPKEKIPEKFIPFRTEEVVAKEQLQLVDAVRQQHAVVAAAAQKGDKAEVTKEQKTYQELLAKVKSLSAEKAKIAANGGIPENFNQVIEQPAGVRVGFWGGAADSSADVAPTE